MKHEEKEGYIECIECGGEGDLPDATICEVCEGEGLICEDCLMPETWCECAGEDST